MTFVFNPNIPAGPNNPSNDQPLMLQNNQSTNSIIAVDHVTFNITQNPNGYHVVIHFVDQNTTNPGAIVGVGQLYTKTVNGDQRLFFESGNGVVTQITNPNSISTVVLKASAIFTSQNTNGAAALVSSNNITSITRNGLGRYDVVMTNALSNTNYYVMTQVTGTTPIQGAGPLVLVNGVAKTTTTFSIISNDNTSGLEYQLMVWN